MPRVEQVRRRTGRGPVPAGTQTPVISYGQHADGILATARRPHSDGRPPGAGPRVVPQRRSTPSWTATTSTQSSTRGTTCPHSPWSGWTTSDDHQPTCSTWPPTSWPSPPGGSTRSTATPSAPTATRAPTASWLPPSFNWLTHHYNQPGLGEATKGYRIVSSGAKAVELTLVRAVGGRTVDLQAVTGTLAADWTRAAATLDDCYPG